MVGRRSSSLQIYSCGPAIFPRRDPRLDRRRRRALLLATLAPGRRPGPPTPATVTSSSPPSRPECSRGCSCSRWQRPSARTRAASSSRIYGGGIQGDEKDVLRKVRAGQLATARRHPRRPGSDRNPMCAPLGRPHLRGSRLRARRLEDHPGPQVREKGLHPSRLGRRRPVHLFLQATVRTMADSAALRLWIVEARIRITRDLLAALEVNGVPMACPRCCPPVDGQIVSPSSARRWLRWRAVDRRQPLRQLDGDGPGQPAPTSSP